MGFGNRMGICGLLWFGSAPSHAESWQSTELTTWPGQTILTWYVDGGDLDGDTTLLLSQARFQRVDGRVVPEPATLEILTRDGREWSSELLLDPDAAVFHKAILWEEGILSISGGMPNSDQRAHLKYWTRTGETWTARTLWTSDWDSSKHRLRDFEIGDVDGDGQSEIVLATHDQGYVVVLDEAFSPDSIRATRLDFRDNTYVHEIELGDVDGDGRPEIFATPSDPNRAGETQPGTVVMYRYENGEYHRTLLDHTERTHAKEILAADLDGDGVAELFSAVEAIKEGGTVLSQVEIRQFLFENGEPMGHRVVATIDDQQLRFMMAHDFDGDGTRELVLAPMNTGIYILRLSEDGSATVEQIESDSGGFEHATSVLDPDGDGRYEIYTADDENKRLLRLDYH